MALNIIILAAGIGKRMHSDLPKVLHPLAGKPMLEHVVQIVQTLSPNVYIVYREEKVKEVLQHLSVNWVKQDEPLGTGHAVQQVLSHLKGNNRALILCGDTPLITVETLQRLVSDIDENNLGCLTAVVKHPKGFGRIIRDKNNRLKSIVEERDATREQRRIREINAGIYIVPVKYLKEWLPKLQDNNAQKEYYLTDIIQLAVYNFIAVDTTLAGSIIEIQGVNDREQLARIERYWQQNNAQQCMQKGLTLLDPHRFDVRGELSFGRDVTIDVNVIIEGKVSIGNRCKIGPNVFLRHVKIADDVEIQANSVIEEAEIGNHCAIGPFARIRPQTKLSDHVKIGNFVEVKKSTIGENSKANHLTYIGDTTIGKSVNVGAGTITCNYDGANKNKTTLKDNVFIGSNTALIAPVTIGEGATIGAGSVITEDTPKDKLTLARAKQTTIENWKRPKKHK